MSWGPDRWRLYGLALREIGRAMRESLSWGFSRLRMSSSSPTRLLFAPQDLRTADPTIATEIYSGFFAFAGRSSPPAVALRSASLLPAGPGPKSLYGFGWLRHLRAAGTALAQANARSLVDEFVSSRLGDRRIATDPQIVARRLISFISQSPLILEGADHAFYQRFLRIVGNLVRISSGRAGGRPAPTAAHSRHRTLLRGPLLRGAREIAAPFVPRLLARELDRQILADGGHASRNPRVLVDLLFDLLPLRQMFASREVDTPEALLHAIDRMLPMVRLFRHGDGTLSHFNGMGVTAADHLATLLTYDDMRSQTNSPCAVLRL